MTILAVLGASGHGRVVADTARLCGWEKIIFFDDAWPARSRNDTWTVAGNSSKLFEEAQAFDGCLVAIGNNRRRWDLTKELENRGGALVNIIHPSATISKSAKLAKGILVAAGAVIAINADIGVGSIINHGATIDHDCRLDAGVHICPGVNLAGNVSVGLCAWVGIGSSIIQGINVGSYSEVGAGSVIIRDIPDQVRVAGNPAKSIGSRT